jgi:hypothetical protein
MEPKPILFVMCRNTLANLLYKTRSVDPYPHWECGSGSKRAKNNPQKYNKRRNFIF